MTGTGTSTADPAPAAEPAGLMILRRIAACDFTPLEVIEAKVNGCLNRYNPGHAYRVTPENFDFVVGAITSGKAHAAYLDRSGQVMGLTDPEKYVLAISPRGPVVSLKPR